MALPDNPNATAMPTREELALALITEELKSRRFFNTLLELGLDNSYYEPHLTEVILRLVGLNDDRNETMEFFCSTLDQHAEVIGIKEESVREQATVVYAKLVEYKSSIQGKD